MKTKIVLVLGLTGILLTAGTALAQETPTPSAPPAVEPEPSVAKPLEGDTRTQLAPQEQKVVLDTLYWAEIGKTCATMDITTFPMSLEDELSKLAMMDNGEVDPNVECKGKPVETSKGVVQMLPPDSTVTVLTVKGPVQLKVRGFWASTGASSSHLIVYMDGNPKFAGLAGLGVINQELPKDLKLRSVPKPDDRDAQLMTLTRDNLVEYAADDAAAILPKLKVSSKNMSLVRAKLPGKGAALVSIHAHPEGMDEINLLSALVAVDKKGKILHVFNPPAVQIERYDFLNTVDLDRDGIDEVILRNSYYEGNYIYLLRWNNGEAQLQQLTGDGA